MNLVKSKEKKNQPIDFGSWLFNIRMINIGIGFAGSMINFFFVNLLPLPMKIPLASRCDVHIFLKIKHTLVYASHFDVDVCFLGLSSWNGSA